MLEVTDAVISVWGSSRVGMHLAPRGDSHSMGDSNPAATFGYVAKVVSTSWPSCVLENPFEENRIGPQLKAAFGGVYIANQGLTHQEAQGLLDAGEADAVAFGRLFIANPDLPKRFALNSPLNEPNPATFYASGAAGYTDYPSLELAAANA